MSANNRLRRSKMATKEDIHLFWCESEKLHNLGIEINTQDIHCFGCGSSRYVERAHILAISKGGGVSPESMHMLCKSCHAESEPYDGDIYWSWLQYKNKTEYKTELEWLLHRINNIDGYLEWMVSKVDFSELGLSKDEAISIVSSALKD